MTHQAQNACILLAAGSSRRMGKNKLELPFAGTTILERCANAIRGAAFQKRVVVLSSEQEAPAGFQAIKVPSGTPMHGSLRTGISLLESDCEYFCVALADQPFLTTAHLNTLINTWSLAQSEEKNLVIPLNTNGSRGNPALIHRDYIPEILAHADEDRGCFYLFKNHPEKVKELKTEDKAFFTDIDTKEDYACAISSC